MQAASLKNQVDKFRKTANRVVTGMVKDYQQIFQDMQEHMDRTMAAAQAEAVDGLAEADIEIREAIYGVGPTGLRGEELAAKYDAEMHGLVDQLDAIHSTLKVRGDRGATAAANDTAVQAWANEIVRLR